MTAAQPAALTDTLGMQGDVARRNATLTYLARKNSRLKEMHSPAGTGTQCGECGKPWPCPTRQVLDERPVL